VTPPKSLDQLKKKRKELESSLAAIKESIRSNREKALWQIIDSHAAKGFIEPEDLNNKIKALIVEE
jgi:hypothetical protein